MRVGGTALKRRWVTQQRVHLVTNLPLGELAERRYESIINPNAKIAPGYQANFMPKFPMSKEEINSLVLYIKSIKKIHD